MKLVKRAWMQPRWMVAGGVVVLVTAGFVLAQHRGEPAKADAIRTAQVTRGNIVLSVSATGTVEPASMVEVRSRATGTVTRVLVDEGQRVRLGQVLVELNDPDSRHAVESYRAAARSAEAAVAVAQAKLDDLRAGATVYTRQQSEEAVRQAEAALAQAKDNLTRQEQLLRDGYVAQSIVDDARHNVDIAESQLRAARARLSDLIAGSTPAQIAQAESAVRQARAQADQTAAALQQAEEQLAESRIAAPITGVVVKRSVDVGQSIIGGSGTGGTLVITLAQVDPLYAAVNVDEADIAGVRAGMPVRLTADALPNSVIRGKVDRVAAVAQVVQNVTQFAVTVVLQEPPSGVRLGMTVDADFVTARRDNVLLVPRQAVKEGKSPTVTVIVGGELETRSVQTGLSDGHMVEIISGLREGEVVLLGSAKQPAKSSPGRSPFQPQYKKK